LEETHIEITLVLVKGFIAASNVSFNVNGIMKKKTKKQLSKQRGTGSPMHASEENRRISETGTID
jgi:hypothetical protein